MRNYINHIKRKMMEHILVWALPLDLGFSGTWVLCEFEPKNLSYFLTWVFYLGLNFQIFKNQGSIVLYILHWETEHDKWLIFLNRACYLTITTSLHFWNTYPLHNGKYVISNSNESNKLDVANLLFVTSTAAMLKT